MLLAEQEELVTQEELVVLDILGELVELVLVELVVLEQLAQQLVVLAVLVPSPVSLCCVRVLVGVLV